MMKPFRSRSAISFVVALLALSGKTIATPAEVSGNADQLTATTVNASNHELRYALNRYPAAVKTPVTAEQRSADSHAAYDEQFLDYLQQKLNAELDVIIDHQHFYTR